MKIGFTDSEGRRYREDGRRAFYIWPFTDFDGNRNDLATARHLAWNWYVLRPIWWAEWYLADAWDPHGTRKFEMGSAPPPWWGPVLRPVAAPGRWLHRHCFRCGRPHFGEPEDDPT